MKAASVANPSISLPAEESLDKDSVLSSGTLKNNFSDTAIKKSYLEALKHMKYPIIAVALIVLGITIFSLWGGEARPGNSGNRSNFAQLNADLGNATTKSSDDTTLQINVDTLVKNSKNTSNTFLIQNASGESLFRVDGANTQIEVNGLLSVNGDIVSNGTIVLGGGSSLNSEGLRINNILVCDATGCVPRPGASGTIDLNNIDAGNITSGTLSDSRLSGSVTLQGNIFNGPNQLVKLDGSGQLPPGVVSGSFAQLNANQTFSGDNIFSSASNFFTGNGSGLSSLNASNIASGTLNNSRLSASVTLQGNSFNGVSQLLQLDGSGNLPALNASALTSLNATNISSGTLSDLRLSANVSLLGSSIDSTEITNDSITDSDINSAAGISWSKISKTGSSLADLATRSATDLSSGTLADARLSTNVALLDANQTFTGDNIFQLASAAFAIQDAATPLGINLFEVTDSTGATVYFNVDATGAFVNGDEICTVAGNCAGVGGQIGGGGTTGTIALFTAGSSIGDSILTESSGTVTAAGNLNVTGQYRVAGSQISSANLSNDANLAKLNGTQTFSGDNTFSSVSNSFTGNGSGLTSLNASNLSSGTVNDGRLSSNVALENAANTFTNTNSIAVTNVAAFQLQSASAAETLFTANTNTRTGGVAGNTIKVGNDTGSDTDVTILVVDSTNTAGIPSTNLSSLNGGLFYNSQTNKLSIIENGTVKILCNQTDASCGGNSTTLQQSYTASTGGTTPEMILDATRIGIDIQDRSTSNGGSLGANLLAIRATAANDTTLGTSLFSINSTGQVLSQNSVNSTTAFQVQNANSANLFSIDSTNSGSISLLANNSGETYVWQTNPNTLPLARHFPATATANGFVYAIGGSNASNAGQTNVYYAKLNADGSVGGWNTGSNSLPAGRTRTNAVVANGYVYIIGGEDGSFVTQSTVYYAKLNADGSVGGWNTGSNSLPAARKAHATLTSNGFVYVIGGSDNAGTVQSTVYYAKLNADGSVGGWNTAANPLTAVRAESASIVANGYVYIMGGYNGVGAQSTVYYAKLNADGSVGSWNTAGNALPANRRSTPGVAVMNGYVYVIGGFDSPNTFATVYFAALNADGSVGGWTTAANSIPANRSAVGSVSSNGYIYIIGGSDGTNQQSSVYYASTSRIRVGGSLDLVGLSGEDLNEIGAGGSIVAGDITSVGNLQVQGAGTFVQGLSVGNGAQITGQIAQTFQQVKYLGGADATSLANSGTGASTINSSAISGSYLYTVKNGISTNCNTGGDKTGCELQIYNLSNASAPVFIGGADASGSTNSGTAVTNFNSISITGRYAYIGKEGNATACSQTAGSAIGCELQVYDISNPAVPTYVGGADASGSANSGTGNNDISSTAISGRYLYVTKSLDGTACSQTAGSAIGCELQVYDISNPAVPTYVGGADASGSANSGTVGTTNFNSIFITGRYAYIGKDGNSTACSQTAGSAIGCELQVYDISNPAVPAYVGGADSTGSANSGVGFNSVYLRAINVSGRYAYVLYLGNAGGCSATAGSATGCELKVYDISNPAVPTYVGGADASGSANSGTGASNFLSISSTGRHAYITKAADATACSQTPGSAIGCELQVYDISNPAVPTYVGGADASGSTNSGTGSSAMWSTAISGRYIYATKNSDATACSQTAGSSIGCELQVYDTSGIDALNLTSGNISTSSLQVQDASSFNSSVSINGGLSVSRGIQSTGDMGLTGLFAQSLTNSSSTGGTVNGYNQSLTVSNTASTSNTNGINITLTESTSLANVDKGINITLAGGNSSAAKYGVYTTADRGVAFYGISQQVGSSQDCVSGTTGSVSAGICAESTVVAGATNRVAGVFGGIRVSTGTNSLTTAGGAGVYGQATPDPAGTGGVASNYYVGVKGQSKPTANADYTSVGVYGDATGGATSNIYGGYFTLQATGAAASAALYASNGTATNNIFTLQDNVTDVVTVANGGAALFKNQTNSATAFQVQTASSESLFSVDSTRGGAVTVLGNNSADLTSWTLNGNNLPDARKNHSAVVANGYMYVIGGQTSGGTWQATVYYGKLNADGTVSSFTTSSNPLPVTRAFHTAVVANGYIYVIGGNDGSNILDTVIYSKINADGSNGPWATSSVTLPATRAYHTSVAANGYLYVIGGSTISLVPQNTVYYSKINADGSINAFNTTNTISARNSSTSVVANGYLYVLGGSDTTPTPTNTVQYAKLNSTGTVGSWNTTNTLVDTREGGDAVVLNGYIYYLGGFGADEEEEVFFAQLNAAGTTGVWNASPTMMLPGARDSVAAVTANGYIYAVGGIDTGGTSHDSVYYASTPRLRVGGGLDLVGLSGENLNEGGSGGTLTAGNTTIVGALNVQDSAYFNNSVAINATLSVAGDTAIKSITNSTSAFQVQNASAATIINIDTSTNNLITNGSFEANTTGWSAKISLSTGMVRQTTYARNGSASASFTTSATAGSGVRYGSFALSSNTMYNFSAQVRTNYGTVAANTIVLGYQNTANQTDTTSDNDCATSPAITTGWTLISCTFTTGTVTGGGVIYLKQTDATSRALFIDSAQLTLYSQLANPSIEQAISGNWIAKNSATVTQDNTQTYIGTNSLKIVTTTASTDGARQSITLTTSTSYTLSFYAKLDGASAALTTMEAGYSSDGSTDGNVCITGQTVVSTGWTKYTCTLVTPASTSGTPFMYIKHASATAHTFYVDSVQLIKGQMNDGYQDGRITLNGIISNSVTLQNANDSTGAFQVQKADGTSLFTIDTSNNMITLGSASSTPVLLVLGIKNTSGDPTCTSGAIYYNSSANQFRGCNNGVWKEVGGRTSYKGYSAVTVDGSVQGTTETTLFSQSIAGGVIGANGTMKVRLYLNTYNNYGADENGTLRIKFGGTTVESRLCYLNQGAVATEYPAFVEFSIRNENATNSQRLTGLWSPGNGQTKTTPLGGTAAIDTTSAQTLEVTWQLSRAVGADVVYYKGYEIEIE